MDQKEQSGSLSSFINDFAADSWDDEEPTLPEHLLRLADQRWGVWRTAVLRGAGFPIAHVLKLSSPACAAAAMTLMQAERNLARCREAARETVRQQMQTTPPDQRMPLVKALRQLKKGKWPAPGVVGGEAATALAELHAAREQLQAAQVAFEAAFQAATAQISDAISEAAAMERFREAVTWQNRSALHTAINQLLRHPSGSAFYKRSNKHVLVANYLQRYCAKNDTIGFFGPVAWATFVPQGQPIRFTPGDKLLEAREVFFEGWCIDTLAETLARQKAIRPWLAPRRMPFIHLDGAQLHLPLEQPMQLSPKQAVVLQACDGQRIAREIAVELLRAPTRQFAGEADVYQVLDSLHTMGLIAWTLEVPLESRPERTLRRLLERIGDESLRRPALNALAELESARAAVARAAGSVEQLDQALEQLETTFNRITGAMPTRSAGQTYAARTLVYEECRRDLELELGPAVLDALGGPLSLLLLSARWITAQAAAAYRETFKQIYADLAHKSGSSTVAALDFWLKVQELLQDDSSQIVQAVTEEFQARWAAILSIPPDQRRVEYSSDALREPVETAFGDAQPGWSLAHYHSPDVMIAAPDAEAIERDEYLFVMGELHVAHNTIGGAAFLTQHPAPEDLFQAVVQDLPGPRLVPVTPRNWHHLTARTRSALVSPWDYRLLLSKDACGVQKSRAVPIGALVIEPADDSLTIRTRDGKLRFDIVEAFGSLLSNIVANSFKVLRPARHTPRVTIDRLVIAREAWSFAAAEIAFAASKHEAERFLAVQRWADEHGMPRFVFVKVPVEVKPFFVDFASPIYIDILSRMIRRTVEHAGPDARVTCSEMLPMPDQTWLADAQGQHYTSELRIVGVDLSAYDSGTRI
ncbi:MAG TPA: lantibiotic dehydratase [Herpetosiphonaceae bacterium]